MCRNWELFGTCKFLDTCSFAHGDHELKGKAHLPTSYKTRACVIFHTDLTCNYGSRCQFLHAQRNIYKADQDYSAVLRENARLTQQRQVLVEGQDEQIPYLNVFKTNRLRVFSSIAKWVWLIFWHKLFIHSIIITNRPQWKIDQLKKR